MDHSQYTKSELQGHPIWGSLPLMRSDSLALLDQCGAGGDIVSYRFVNHRIYGVHHPDLIKEVLVSKYELFVKEGIYSRLDPVFRNGLLTAKGAFWKQQRRIIQPAFGRKNLQCMVSIMADVIREFHDEVAAFEQIGEPIDMFSEMLKLALNIINKTMFSNDVSIHHREIADHIYALNVFMKRRNFSVVPMPVWIPTKDNRSFHRALGALDKIIMEIIDRRMSSGQMGDDLLGMLLSSTDPETGEKMSIAQVRAEAVTIFITGHETTATAMSWAYYLLGKHPVIMSEMHASIDSVFSDAPSAPVETKLESLKFLDDIFTESLRMRPPIYVTYRQASEDTVLGGVKIKKGDSVHLSPYIMNKDPRFWTEPETFKPSRYTDGEGADKFAFFPFGAGPRSCIGAHFSTMEARMILATLGRSFEFNLVAPDQDVEPEPLVTLKPRDPLMMTVKRRH